MDIFEDAMRITDRLAKTVSALEAYCGEVFNRAIPPQENVQSAIRMVWPRLVANAQATKVSSEVQYVAALYNQIADAALVAKPGSFVDRTDIPWDVYYREGCGDESRCEDAWVVCELFWGGYVPTLHITLGWLLMDAIRVQNGLRAIAPAPDSFARFADDLRASGPELFDAESLRGLFYEYEAE